MNDIVISIEGLGKRYRLGARAPRYRTLRESLMRAAAAPVRRLREGTPARPEYIWALKDISFQVRRGEVVGIIGPNGAGKSTLLKILSRITAPTEGRGVMRGRVGSLLEVGTGFHPELTGRENIYLNGAILGMTRSEVRSKFDEIVAFSEVEQFLDTPVKRYSSGMSVRLAFAVAAHLEPEILLVDEVLAVGDMAFQRKCLGKMGDVARAGRTILFVSHNMAAVQNLCEKAYLLVKGRVAAAGRVSEVVDSYLASAGTSYKSDLAGRTDRRGDGRLRLTDFSAVQNGQERQALACGAPTEFVIRYEAAAPPRNIFISVELKTPLGQQVIQLSNEMTGDAFENAPQAGTFVCRFGRLPLLPGTYTVNLFCSLNGIIADWLTEAASIQVTEGDFFGSGKLPSARRGFLVVPHRWEIG
jgi:lipopolysaccharide transport system ATP-binding protein